MKIAIVLLILLVTAQHAVAASPPELCPPGESLIEGVCTVAPVVCAVNDNEILINGRCVQPVFIPLVSTAGLTPLPKW